MSVRAFGFTPQLFVVSTEIGCGGFLKDFLSRDEHEHLERLRFEKDQSLFIYTRGCLRYILGKVLNEDPSSFRFNYTKYGKPYLDQNIQFNVSHSGNRGLIGITGGDPIGVDLEEIRRFPDMKKVAEKCFTEDEIVDILNAKLPFFEGFYKIWTRKESFIKAIGQGLSYPLKDFKVSLSAPFEITILNSLKQSYSLFAWKNGGYELAATIEGKHNQCTLTEIDNEFFH